MKSFRLSIIFIILFLLISACGENSTSFSGTDNGTSNVTLMGGSVQGKALSLSGTVTTIAGPQPGFDGTGLEAVFRVPYALTTDGTNLYVADTWNQTIRKIVIASRVVTTLAGSAGTTGSMDGTGAASRFNYPSGITLNGAYLFVSDTYNHTIRKIEIATGIVTTLGGSAGLSGSADGIGTLARFNMPSGITSDGTNLYVADYGNSTIRKVVIATGAVSTIAGSPGNTGSTDGIGTAARFLTPHGIAIDGSNLYVADYGNGTIRKVVIATGDVTTFAGTAGNRGSADGTGTAATFWYPRGIIADGTSLYIADPSNNTIRRIEIATAVVTTFAGSSMSSGTKDGIGTAAKFEAPSGITTDGTNLFVSDSGSGRIRCIVISTSSVTTIAGNPADGFTDGTGSEARFSSPAGITTDGVNLFVADAPNNAIRSIEISTNIVTTLAGSKSSGNADGIGNLAQFNLPAGITTDGTNLFITDMDNSTIRKVVIATGAVTTIAGSAGNTGSTDGVGVAARFNRPSGITTDGTNLYVADSENAIIRKIVIATGEVTTLAGSGALGHADGTGTAASFWWPRGITTDGTNLFIVDDGNHTIRKVVISTAVVTTVAGSAGNSGSADGTGDAARFLSPGRITTDGTNLYVTDSGNSTIRKIVIAAGVVTTLAGSAGNASYADGNGDVARFSYPGGITTNGISLFVSDRNNCSIRKIN